MAKGMVEASIVSYILLPKCPIFLTVYIFSSRELQCTCMLRMSYSDSFLFVVHLCIRPLTFSNDFSSETAEPIFAQISYGASLGWGNERFLKWLRSFDKDGPHAHKW